MNSGGPAAELVRLNQAAPEEALAALLRCCGSRRWAAALVRRRPFQSLSELQDAAAQEWGLVSREDVLEAFSEHPPIGADLEALRSRFAATAALSAGEQSGAAGAAEATLRELRELNQRYLERFGYIFIVCASGLTAEQMLHALRRRVDHPPEMEFALAAAEQAKIMQLRLKRLFS